MPLRPEMAFGAGSSITSIVGGFDAEPEAEGVDDVGETGALVAGRRAAHEPLELPRPRAAEGTERQERGTEDEEGARHGRGPAGEPASTPRGVAERHIGEPHLDRRGRPEHHQREAGAVERADEHALGEASGRPVDGRGGAADRHRGRRRSPPRAPHHRHYRRSDSSRSVRPPAGEEVEGVGHDVEHGVEALAHAVRRARAG